MAKSPTALILELEAVVEGLKEQLRAVRGELANLTTAVKEGDNSARESILRLEGMIPLLTERVIRLEERADQLRREVGTSGVADLRQEIALVRQLAADQQKRIDKWDTRLWAVVAGVLLFLLSSVITLVVAITRK